MHGIDWDKVKRDRNARKPHYWENFEREWNPSALLQKPLKPATVPNCRYFAKSNPRTAREIRSKLRSLGLLGKTLTERTNAILRGETHLAWVEFEIDFNNMVQEGFVPRSPEHQGEAMVMLFEKRSADGRVQEDRVYTFRKLPGARFKEGRKEPHGLVAAQRKGHEKNPSKPPSATSTASPC